MCAAHLAEHINVVPPFVCALCHFEPIFRQPVGQLPLICQLIEIELGTHASHIIALDFQFAILGFRRDIIPFVVILTAAQECCGHWTT